jgi:hypothetical protein
VALRPYSQHKANYSSAILPTSWDLLFTTMTLWFVVAIAADFLHTPCISMSNTMDRAGLSKLWTTVTLVTLSPAACKGAVTQSEVVKEGQKVDNAQ